MDKFQVLNSTFGHSSFRAFQEEAVDALLAKKDLHLYENLFLEEKK